MSGRVPGSRRAARPARGRPTGRIGGPVAVLLLAAGAALLAPGEQRPGSEPAATGSVPLERAELGCPRLEAVPEGLRSTFSLASVPLDDPASTGSPGSLLVTPPVTPPVTLAPGESTEVEAESADGLSAVAEGDLARGLVGWRADAGADRTAVVRCGAPRAGWWFPGAGATVDHTSVLTLANLDPTPAVVDISALSIDGPLDAAAAGGTGLTLAPGERAELPLTDLLPSTDEVTLQVRADRGRVVAGVFDSVTEPDGVGAEWLPSLEQPSRDLRLAGVPARADRRTLLVANPTERATLVSLEVAGPSGRFVPAGLEDLSVEPGSITSVDLTEVLAGEAYAVRLRAQRPVVATVRSQTRAPETTYAAPVIRLRGPGSAPVVGATEVQLASGPEVTRATARAFSDTGEEVGSFRFSLAPVSVATWKVPRGAAYVVVEPTQGRAYGAAVYDDRSAHPLVQLPVEVRVPAVRPEG